MFDHFLEFVVRLNVIFSIAFQKLNTFHMDRNDIVIVSCNAINSREWMASSKHFTTISICDFRAVNIIICVCCCCLELFQLIMFRKLCSPSIHKIFPFHNAFAPVELRKKGKKTEWTSLSTAIAATAKYWTRNGITHMCTAWYDRSVSLKRCRSCTNR